MPGAFWAIWQLRTQVRLIFRASDARRFLIGGQA
jgi:hypothetical protein